MERRVLVSQYRLSIYITPIRFRYASLKWVVMFRRGEKYLQYFCEGRNSLTIHYFFERVCMNIMKFGDIPYGTIFRENRSNPRRFIKIQDVLPSGLKSFNYRRSSGKIGDTEYKEEDQPLIPFNSVDLDSGCTAKCPDWLEYVVERLGCFSK